VNIWPSDEPNKLDPLSKLFEEYGDAGELDKAGEVCGIVLPANKESPLPLQPGKEAFDEPAALIAAEVPAILGLEFPSRAMRGNQVHADLLEGDIEAVTVIGTIPNEILWLASSM